MDIRLLLENYRNMFKKIDKLYAENPRDDVRKLNDDLLFAVRYAINERCRFFGSVEKAERKLKSTLEEVEERYKKIVESGTVGTKRRVEATKNLLKNLADEIKTKYEEIKNKRLNLESKAKALIKDGRIEDAEIIIPKITSLESNERLLKKYAILLGKVESRFDGLLTNIETYETIRKLPLKELNLNEVKDIKEKVEKELDNLGSIERDLGSFLEMLDVSVLGSTLTEKEKKTLKRLIEEVGEVQEHVKRYIDELEETEERLREMKS